MKFLHVLMLIISLSTLYGFALDLSNFMEFGETTGTSSGWYFYTLGNNYILGGTSYGFSIFQSELDGSLTLIDTINTRNHQSLTYNDNYLVIINWLMSNIEVYNIEDKENIYFSHTIETNYNILDIYLLDNSRLIVNKVNENSFLLDVVSGEQLNNYPDYYILIDTFLNDGRVLAYNHLSNLRKWIRIDNQNQIIPIRTETRNISYAKSAEDNIYLLTDNYLKIYEAIEEEEAHDSLLVNWYGVGFDSRGIEFLDSKLYFIDGDINSNSQMEEPVLKIYDIIDNQFQFFSQEFFLENWDNRGYYLCQKAISCNNYIYVNAEEEGIKGYQIINNEFEQISQYGDIAYWENSFLTRDNKVYINARKKDRECIIYDIVNVDNPTIIENDFAFGEYHSFPYQSDYLYKKSYLDNEVEFYNLNSDDTISLVGSIPEEYYYLYEHFIPLMMDENYLVYQFYNNVFVGAFVDGDFLVSYTFNLGSNSNSREFSAFMKNNHLYSLNMANSSIDIYQVDADSYTFILTNHSYTFDVHIAENILSFSDEYVCFNGSGYYYYLLSIDSESQDISGVYRLDYEDKVFNNIDNYLFVGKSGLGANDRLLEVKVFNPDNQEHFTTLESIILPARLNSVNIIQVDNYNYNLLVTTKGSLFYYQCAITSNGNLDITPVTLNAINYPNPFNPETTISYDISQQSQVTVDIYNLKGQKVKSLLQENQEAGQHSIIWKGDNDEGKRVSSGSYFYRVKSGDEEIVNKMMLMK